jgi:proteasome lid subunit RPN8/RPN11
MSNTKVEVCGVMIGSTHRDAWGPYLLIHACIPAADAHSHSANVTFTAKAWAQIHAEMDRRFPDDRIVGWYHTHPGFGIFLSDMDLFIQGNFFNLPWQVAFVYDPVGGDEGMFVWRRGIPTREAILTEPAPAEAAPIVLPRAAPVRGGMAFLVLATILMGLIVTLLAVTEVRGTGWVLDLIGRFTRP